MRQDFDRIYVHPNDGSILVVEMHRADRPMTYDHLSTKVMAETPSWRGLNDDSRQSLLDGGIISIPLPAGLRR